jgi:lysophospholipase L1-like esterase
MYLFYHSYLVTYKENFDKQKQIILLGDSILENSNYVEKYFNVESYIKKKHPHVLNLAQDQAVINNLSLQIKNLKQKKINKGDIIFVSVGGNDIMNHYRFKKKNKHKRS